MNSNSLVQFATRENISSAEFQKQTRQNCELQHNGATLHQNDDTVTGIIIFLFDTILNHFSNKENILSAENTQRRTRQYLRNEVKRLYTKDDDVNYSIIILFFAKIKKMIQRSNLKPFLLNLSSIFRRCYFE